jgi:hypothetical protein
MVQCHPKQLDADAKWVVDKAVTALERCHSDGTIARAFSDAMRGKLNPKQLSAAAEEIENASREAVAQNVFVIVLMVSVAFLGYKYVCNSDELFSQGLKLMSLQAEVDSQRKIERIRTGNKFV